MDVLHTARLRGARRPVASRTCSISCAFFLISFAFPLTAPAADNTVSGIEVTIDVHRVRVEVSISEDSGELVAYRHIRPIQESEHLAEAIEVARLSPGEVAFFDNPHPGVPSYYAVLRRESIVDGSVTLLPGINSTDRPVRISTGSTAVTESDPEERTLRRGRSLPLLNPEVSAITGEALPPTSLPTRTPRSVREETTEAIDALLERSGQMDHSHPEPRVLEPELENGSENDGTLRLLRQAIRSSFRRGAWDEAVEWLEALLTLPLTDGERERVHFYLGQARYFSGNYRRAVLSMIHASNRMYEYTRPWIESALEILAAQEHSP